jgi:hypothetical protein
MDHPRNDVDRAGGAGLDLGTRWDDWQRANQQPQTAPPHVLHRPFMGFACKDYAHVS